MGTRCPVTGMCVPWSQKVGCEQSMSSVGTMLGLLVLGALLCVHVSPCSALQLRRRPLRRQDSSSSHPHFLSAVYGPLNGFALTRETKEPFRLLL